MSKSNETWQMMVAVVRRAIRLTQPPVVARKVDKAYVYSRNLSIHVEDHYALLVAAGY